MIIKEDKIGEVMIIGLDGRLDATTSPGVEKHLLEIIERGDIRIVLDFSELTYISSLGLRILIVAAKQVQQAKGKLVLAALSAHIHEIFKIAGFTSIFPIHATRDEAVTCCAS